MKTVSERCHVYASENINADINELASPYKGGVYLLMDTRSQQYCQSVLGPIEGLSQDHILVVEDGDDNKNPQTAVQIWEFLSSHGATRKSLLINLGGGMICDLGGFCASTFKRGIDFINIPTTVLAQVDASLGGKTGMNLGSLKNEVGVFSMAKAVVLHGEFLKTLDKENLLSGFAEMIKHALIHNAEALDTLLSFDFGNPDYNKLSSLIAESVKIKEFFVEADPTEKGIRKALNFGHTYGHAYETFALRHNAPVLHGYAVAWGMIKELQLSAELSTLDKGLAKQIADRIVELYGQPNASDANSAELHELMTHDKKNDGRGINFTLIPSIGQVEVDHVVNF
ncbi:MAG: 3-dehydroquinate synthase family protein [Bacteroidia bacterium]|nr:3-dehydroquinate synthase family protein [Bacteroidia bacterium]